MNNKKVIVISALTYLALNLISAYPVLLILAIWAICVYLALVISDDSLVAISNQEGSVHAFMTCVLGPLAFIFALADQGIATSLDNLWLHFFSRDFPKFKFRSPIEFDKEEN